MNAIQALPDGKLIVVGGFNAYNDRPVGRVIRLNADGTLDPTFNNQTVTASETGVDATIILQQDGKIVIKCLGMVTAGQSARSVLRLNPDGTLDNTFSTPSNTYIQSMFADSLGRLVFFGHFTTPQGARRIIRTDRNGALDNSFDHISKDFYGIATQGNKILVSSDLNGSRQIYRLDEEGSVDSTFRPIRGTSYSFISVLPNNKVLYRTSTQILRANENGTADRSFQAISMPDNRQIYVQFDSESRIVIAHRQFANVGTVDRFMPSGTPDESFTQYSQPYLASFTIQHGDRIVLGDSNQMSGNTGLVTYFTRLTSSGTVDTTFNPGTGFQTLVPGVIQAIATQPDGKVLLAGKFEQINGVFLKGIARLNHDSTVDSTFALNTSGSGNHFVVIRDLYQVRVQVDGKMVISGFFDYVLNGVTKRNLVRINADGSIDPTFDLSYPIQDYSQISLGGQNRFVLYEDGGLLVGTSKTGVGNVGPVKLFSGGSRDATFDPTLHGTSPSLYYDDVAIQPEDGKIIASGSYSTAQGTFKSFVARFNIDGSRDLTFPLVEETDRLKSRIVRLPSGKILISKYANPLGIAKVQRLNADGSLDATFHSLTLPDTTTKINTLTVLPTGKIFVGGSFEFDASGKPVKNLLQLNEDGTFADTTYEINEEVFSLAADDEGRVLVGGGFTTIGANNNENVIRSYVARLTDSRAPFDFDGDGKTDLGVFRESTGMWYLKRSLAGELNQTFGIAGDKVAAADYDGDGKADLAIYRKGQWWYMNSSDNSVNLKYWGGTNDIPLPSDIDGDGRADFVFYRPWNGEWIRSSSATGLTSTIQFGLQGDIPVVADMDGDGISDPTIFRPSEGIWWYRSSETGIDTPIQWGLYGDIPVPADYDGDGKTDVAIFRPSEGTWYIYKSTGGYFAFSWGLEGDHPVPGDYDGDGKVDIAIWRPSNGLWFILKSAGGVEGGEYGVSTDKAVQNAFIPAEKEKR